MTRDGAYGYEYIYIYVFIVSAKNKNQKNMILKGPLEDLVQNLISSWVGFFLEK